MFVFVLFDPTILGVQWNFSEYEASVPLIIILSHCASLGLLCSVAYIEFTDSDAFNKSFDLDGSELGGFYLSVQEGRPRETRDFGSGGRGGGRGSGRGGRDGGRFGDRRGGGRFGGGRGGDRGGCGRGRGTPNRITASASGQSLLIQLVIFNVFPSSATTSDKSA